jgi:hypothetical protein
MTKLLASLRLAMLAAFSVTLASCGLYFGDEGGNDNWTYCGSDGYYVCEGDDCQFAGATCPDGTTQPGFTCEDNADCAAGCYCAGADAAAGTAGTCEEAGFCSTDEDCPTGFVCDDRSSCVPPTTEACTCASDSEAQAQNHDYCDESTNTCQLGVDPNGTCGGDPAGALPPTGTKPACAVGEVPTVFNNVYTGQCKGIGQCDVTPSCGALQHEPDCLGRPGECGAVYTGINCRKPDGTACAAGDSGCTCDSFSFNSCATSTGE